LWGGGKGDESDIVARNGGGAAYTEIFESRANPTSGRGGRTGKESSGCFLGSWRRRYVCSLWGGGAGPCEEPTPRSLGIPGMTGGVCWEKRYVGGAFGALLPRNKESNPSAEDEQGSERATQVEAGGKRGDGTQD